MSIQPTAEHLAKAQALVAEAHSNHGLAPLDLDQFWADDAIAHRDPFSPDAPQPALGIRMSHECLFAELGVPEDWRRYHFDPAWLRELAKPYNDKAEKIVGRRLLNESPLPPPSHAYPPVKQLHDIFGAKNVFHSESYYLEQALFSNDELARRLDEVDQLLAGDLRSFLLPPEWDAEKKRLLSLGITPPLYRSQRGPVTFAASIFGAENLIFLILDDPGLATRFSDTIRRAMLARAKILDDEAGWTPGGHGHFGFADDNCCLLNKDMYDLFAKPILKALFDTYAPLPTDSRYQHSDSDMAQHLDTFNDLRLNGCNFGPNLTVAQIRSHIPLARIVGQIAPFTFSRNEEVNLVAETIRDCEMARPARGLNVMTAGSINNGSRLTGLRLIMAAIQRYGRY